MVFVLTLQVDEVFKVDVRDPPHGVAPPSRDKPKVHSSTPSRVSQSQNSFLSTCFVSIVQVHPYRIVEHRNAMT